jgi:hypothetical protein
VVSSFSKQVLPFIKNEDFRPEEKITKDLNKAFKLCLAKFSIIILSNSYLNLNFPHYRLGE